jgi:hypothetical protein
LGSEAVAYSAFAQNIGALVANGRYQKVAERRFQFDFFPIFPDLEKCLLHNVSGYFIVSYYVGGIYAKSRKKFEKKFPESFFTVL